MKTHSKPRPAVKLAAAGIALAAILSGCAAADEPSDTAEAGSAISAERCALNEAAGEITYITGYQYQASVTILDVIAAEQLGYFNDLCLDVTIQPGTGDTASNAQLVAAGTAQLSSLSGDGDLLINVANGVDVTGIATFGHVPIATLMTSDEITDLTELDGTILGQKGALPVDIAAMLSTAGADLDSIEQVVVGYDPTVLTRGQVDSLTGYKSNEPLILEAMGESVTTWNPEDFGVPGSIATLIANPAFAEEHTTVVEDFLRATLHAYEYCGENAAECVESASSLSAAGYDVDHNTGIWETESELVGSSLPDGQDLGTVDFDLMKVQGDFLVEAGSIPSVPDLATIADNSFIEGVYADGSLVWPAP